MMQSVFADHPCDGDASKVDLTRWSGLGALTGLGRDASAPGGNACEETL